jgi:hypothetical protein
VWAAPLAGPLLGALGWSGLFAACGTVQLALVAGAHAIVLRRVR